MKKFMSLSLALLCSSLALADAAVSVRMRVAGKDVEKCCEFNQDAQVWHAEDQGVMIVATTTERDNNEVMVNMQVFMKDENNEPVLVAAPEIVTHWGEAGSLLVTDQTGEEVLILEVVATK